MLFTATHNVCLNANNPSPVLNVPKGQGCCNTGQYIQFCWGGGGGAALTPNTTVWGFKGEVSMKTTPCVTERARTSIGNKILFKRLEASLQRLEKIV